MNINLTYGFFYLLSFYSEKLYAVWLRRSGCFILFSTILFFLLLNRTVEAPCPIVYRFYSNIPNFNWSITNQPKPILDTYGAIVAAPILSPCLMVVS